MVQIFCIVLELCKYHKITQIQNGRLAAILIFLLPKVNGVIVRHLTNIMKRANEHLFVSGRSN